MDSDYFPINAPAHLPAEVEDCKIIQTVIEIRHKGLLPWTLVPGLVYGAIKERFPLQEDLPAAQVPEVLLKSQPDLRYALVTKFSSAEGHSVQLGPNNVCMNFNTPYPGWESVHESFAWLQTRLLGQEILGEGVRLGLRYLDFFESSILPNLKLRLMVEEDELNPPEASVILNLKHERLKARLQVHTSATIANHGKRLKGSTLDVDTWVTATDFDVQSHSLVKTLDEMHEFQKQIFFGLLKEDFLKGLSPRYN